MRFRDIIEEMHRRDPAIRGGALCGSDGLVVEEWLRARNECDMAALCAEASLLFRSAERTADENGLGPARELTLATAEGLLFVHRVDDEYQLVVLTEPGAIPGKWRFLLGQGARTARGIL
jgi:predicted regulator of Ras-like GTPase activity (Roadblock/LC7/MglB family)